MSIIYQPGLAACAHHNGPCAAEVGALFGAVHPPGIARTYRARVKNPGANSNADLEMGNLLPKPLATALQADGIRDPPAHASFRKGVECITLTRILISALILL